MQRVKYLSPEQPAHPRPEFWMPVVLSVDGGLPEVADVMDENAQKFLHRGQLAEEFYPAQNNARTVDYRVVHPNEPATSRLCQLSQVPAPASSDFA